jgi:hypothetical protein
MVPGVAGRVLGRPTLALEVEHSPGTQGTSTPVPLHN